MNLKEKVFDYEKRVLELRNELNELSREDYSSDQMLQNKIYFFQTEISHLNNQLSMIKQSNYNCYYQNTPNTQNISQQNRKIKPKLNVFKQVMDSVINSTMNQKREEFDAEKTFGKTVMAIFASVLIFISIIMFAVVITPLFSDWMKLILMFAVSFCITASGYIFSNKHPTNRFFNALLGCGLSCIYISLFVSHLYFQIIGRIALYLLLIIWSAGVLYVSKAKSNVFYNIGNIGITISLFFGIIMMVTTQEVSLIYSIYVFYIIAYMLFMYYSHNLDFSLNFTSNICTALNIFLLAYASDASDNLITLTITIAMIIIHLLLVVRPHENEEKTKCKYSIIISLFNTLLFACLSSYHYFDTPIISKVIMFLIVAYTIYRLIDFEFIKKSNINIIRIIHIITVASMLICSPISSVFTRTMFLMLIIAIAYFNDNKIYQNTTFIGTLIYTMMGGEFDFSNETFVMFSIIVMVIGNYFLLKKKYSMKYKAIFALSFYIAIIKCSFNMFDAVIGYQIAYPISIAIITIVHFVVSKQYLITNWITNEKEDNMIKFRFLINEFLLISSLYALERMPSTPVGIVENLLFIMIAIALLVIPYKEIIKYEIYSGLRITITTIAILSSFIASPIIISVAQLLLAFAFIMYGFKIDKKHLRIYGLVLSNISIIKLGLFDISYSSTLYRAFALFICGVICFLISYAYNKISKKE